MTEQTLFIIVGAVAVAAAVGMLLMKNAIYSAMFLILNFVCIAFLYLLLDAPFISMVQIAVYAGAIMVLFLFVIMLLGVEDTTDTSGHLRWLSLAVLVLSFVLVAVFGLALLGSQ